MVREKKGMVVGEEEVVRGEVDRGLSRRKSLD